MATGSKLVIVESPTKAKKIGGYLGSGYTVMASVGHIRDLAQPSQVPAAEKAKYGKFGVDIEDGFKPYYIVDGNKKKTVADLKSALKKADTLYLATDEDREGEAIAWHLVQTLKPKVPVKRMVFHEITPEAIKASLNNTRDVDAAMVDAQETRRILDRLYGYELSPVLWRKVGPGLSAGRVQSVATRLIVERERERMAFVRAPYWDVTATLEAPDADGNNVAFDSRMVSLGGRRLAGSKDFGDDGQLTAAGVKDNVVQLDETHANAIARSLEYATFTVSSMETKPYHDLIENHSGGPRELGKDPVSGGTVEVRNGRFGPYVALVMPSAEDAGDTAAESAAGKAGKTKRSGGKKAASDRPKMASLFKTMSPESLTLEDALKLLSLPREVGSYDEANAETGEMQTVTVMANNGRYGPYLTKTGADGKSDTRSLASEDEIFTVDLEKAKELFAQPKYGRGRGRGAAKPPLRDLGTDPETQKHVTIKDGFYGAYITDGETNRTLPKQYAPESIEPAEAFRLLAEKRAQGPSKRRGRKTAAKGAKKGAAKGAKSAKKVSATEQARADRRAKVRELTDKGWANTRIAKEIGSTASTVKADVDWLTANEGYARPEVVPAR